MVLVSKSPLDIVVLPAPNLMSKVARFSGRPATSQRSLWLHNNKDSAGCPQQSCTAGVEKNLCCTLCAAIVAVLLWSRALIALQSTNEQGTVVRTKVPAVRRWPLQPEFATLTNHPVTLVECHG